MSEGKLTAIVLACIAVIIASIFLIHFEPWAGPPPAYTLSVTVNPPEAGSISSSGGEYESGEQVTLTVYPAHNCTFDHWSGDASGNTSTITITMDSDRDLIANFKAIYTLTIHVYPPEAGSVSPLYGEYESGALVTLNATAASGYVFDHWSGLGTWPTIAIIMDTGKNVTAYFKDETSVSWGGCSGGACGCGRPPSFSRNG